MRFHAVLDFDAVRRDERRLDLQDYRPDYLITITITITLLHAFSPLFVIIAPLACRWTPNNFPKGSTLSIFTRFSALAIGHPIEWEHDWFRSVGLGLGGKEAVVGHWVLEVGSHLLHGLGFVLLHHSQP